jgi:hypothetical protein
MSDDPTKRFDEQGKATQPMLSELLEEVRAMRVEVQEVRAEMNARFEHLEIRIDRIESMTNQTRADFREFLSRLKEIA